MRLIDADALFPGKLLVVNLKNPMETAKDLLNRINTAPTIDAAPVMRWISVTEQLPVAGRHVLIYRANGRVSIGHMLLLEAGLDMNNWYKDGVAKFHDVTSYRLVGVTHWMPLPEPPKEGE
jgi:hypothetical protein